MGRGAKRGAGLGRGEGRLGPRARIERGESCFPFSFVCFFLLFPNHFQISLKQF